MFAGIRLHSVGMILASVCVCCFEILCILYIFKYCIFMCILCIMLRAPTQMSYRSLGLPWWNKAIVIIVVRYHCFITNTPNTKHLYKICTTSADHLQHCTNVIQIFCVCWEYPPLIKALYHSERNVICNMHGWNNWWNTDAYCTFLGHQTKQISTDRTSETCLCHVNIDVKV